MICNACKMIDKFIAVHFLKHNPIPKAIENKKSPTETIIIQTTIKGIAGNIVINQIVSAKLIIPPAI